MTTYLGYELLGFRPYRELGASESMDVPATVVESKVGAFKVYYATLNNPRTRTFNWFLSSRQEIADARTFLFARLGSYSAFWVPTWVSDLILTQDVTAGSTTLTFRSTQKPIIRSNLAVITASSITPLKVSPMFTSNVDGTITVSITSGTIPTNLKASETLVSYLSLVRLDTDEIEMKFVAIDTAELQMSYVEVLGEEAIPSAVPPPIGPPPPPTGGTPNTVSNSTGAVASFAVGNTDGGYTDPTYITPPFSPVASTPAPRTATANWPDAYPEFFTRIIWEGSPDGVILYAPLDGGDVLLSPSTYTHTLTGAIPGWKVKCRVRYSNSNAFSYWSGYSNVVTITDYVSNGPTVFPFNLVATSTVVNTAHGEWAIDTASYSTYRVRIHWQVTQDATVTSGTIWNNLINGLLLIPAGTTNCDVSTGPATFAKFRAAYVSSTGVTGTYSAFCAPVAILP